jgi:hypothetical protein
MKAAVIGNRLMGALHPALRSSVVQFRCTGKDIGLNVHISSMSKDETQCLR